MILYEEILPESNPKFTNQFELEDNVAYDPQKWLHTNEFHKIKFYVNGLKIIQMNLS